MNYKEQYVYAYRNFIKRDGSESLLNWLMTTDFFEAPASTQYHGNFPGGLTPSCRRRACQTAYRARNRSSDS